MVPISAVSNAKDAAAAATLPQATPGPAPVASSSSVSSASAKSIVLTTDQGDQGGGVFGIQLATSEDIDDENDPEEVIVHSIS